jgi:murein DD-endopeptidase MepM/ murein hydrolase activator NlpD
MRMLQKSGTIFRDLYTKSFFVSAPVRCCDFLCDRYAEKYYYVPGIALIMLLSTQVFTPDTSVALASEEHTSFPDVESIHAQVVTTEDAHHAHEDEAFPPPTISPGEIESASPTTQPTPVEPSSIPPSPAPEPTHTGGNSVSFLQPVATYRSITSAFSHSHPGVDLTNPIGTPVVASIEGVVKSAGWDTSGYGNCIVIVNGSTSTLYAHLSAVYVTAGQHVGRGSMIGAVGNTGRATGSHLHFEIRENGSHVNPLIALGL